MESWLQALSNVDFDQSEAHVLKSQTQRILSKLCPPRQSTILISHLASLDTLLCSNENTSVLPIVVFIYAIKNILYPSFLIELIPDFIDLLTMVEFYRIRATEEASKALTWNDFYKDIQSIRTLEAQDERFLSHLLDTQEEMRKIFMQIVAECCLIVSTCTHGILPLHLFLHL